jgi:L-lactate dehydrogenase
VANNLAWLKSGATLAGGQPEVLVDRPAIGSWDAGGLPGHWAMYLALEHGIRQARDQGAFTMTLRNCQHVACLASTLMQAIEARMVVLMMVSSPDEAFVSPFGGSERLFSNNPVAFTAPGSLADKEDVWPILFDVSMAITAGGQVARAARLGRKIPEAAIKSRRGDVTDDPAELGRGGSVMPIGGLTHGHKGHALTIMTEVLTQALAGHGRSETRPDSELNNVFLQVMDPAVFTEPALYDREVAHLVSMIETVPPDDPERPVRVPGSRAWQMRRLQLAEGVRLDAGVLESLLPFAEEAGLSPPVPGEGIGQQEEIR